ncbi:MAG: ABC transporter ATP-binding protein [Chloroflexi bacterium]|nr:ABC transporter ATP-binding protein [Chloroflexota bacterium]
MLQVKIEKQLPDFKLNINFETGAEILVLFGASGAGKTMTLNCIAGLLAPDAGAIQFNGNVLFDSIARVNLPARLRRVGYVFQHYALFPHLTVRENVEFGVKDAKGRESAKSRERAHVDELLELVGITSLAARYPSQLSGGQQQRVALARALAPRPDLLLLDEPFSALDAPTRETLRQELRALQARFNLPTIFVTHDLGEAYFLADKLAVMDRGEIVQIGAPGEILLRPRDLRVARAVGVKNILRGVVEARDEKTCHVKVGEFGLETPASSAPVGAEVNVCIRAERVVLMRPERGEESRAENVLEGELLRETSDGSTVTLYFRADAPRFAPTQDFDLQIELPVYIYERLDLSRARRWRVSVRRNGIHLIR